jgi:glycosyltransferase involved in cell wall biosynthesis
VSESASPPEALSPGLGAATVRRDALSASGDDFQDDAAQASQQVAHRRAPRVLHISKFYSPIRGGIEAVAWELVEGLNGAGVQTDVLCSSHAATGKREHFPGNYQVVRANSWGTLLSTSIAPSMAAHLWRSRADYDIVHVHMPDPMAAAAIWAARPQGAVVVHWHSDVVRQRKALKLYEPLQRWLLRRAAAVVATSQAYADSSGPLKPWRSKIEVIPIGISDSGHNVRPKVVSALRQRCRGRKIVFSLGRMTYYKGFEVLIEAAAGLPDDCVVLIGGSGELLDHYRAQVNRRGLAGKVELLGHVKGSELASHYAACDVFCMPSTLRAEAYGVVMVEAMSMGKPVVASDIVGTGVPFVNAHEQTGLNVPVGNAEALVGALSRLLEDVELRKRFGAAARERYEEHFEARGMVRRTLDLYARLRPVSAAETRKAQ